MTKIQLNLPDGINNKLEYLKENSNFNSKRQIITIALFRFKLALSDLENHSQPLKKINNAAQNCIFKEFNKFN